MPKKTKSDKLDPHEGRPSGLTFGDFITIKPKQNQKKTNVNDKLNVAEQQAGASSSAFSVDKEHFTDAAIVDTDKNNERQDGSVLLQYPEIEVTNNKFYFICRTKKGGLPVKVESRSSGKKVTLIENVEGDGKELLHELKIKFGTGGILKSDSIELQGDNIVKVTKYLNERKHLLRPYGTKITDHTVC